MFEADEGGVYLRVFPAAGRRLMALGAIYALGGLLVWLGFAVGVQPLSNLFFIGCGAGLIWCAEKMRQTSQRGVALTVDGLFDTDGTQIVQWDEIEQVERGVFAMKPSNGFGIKLKARAVRSWAPGLWWRTGRRIGVGGLLAPREVRTMGEQMAVLLPQHQNGA